MNSEFKRTGQKFGSLTVIDKDLPTGRSYHWVCRCDCGETRTVEERRLAKEMITMCVQCELKKKMERLKDEKP